MILTSFQQQIVGLTNQASQTSHRLLTLSDHSKDLIEAAVLAHVKACSDKT
jgi:hypothetical protein